MNGNTAATESGRPYAGEDAAARIARRRHQLLAAGLELFGTVGYRNTTVRLLARQAGVTDRYFYESFANMEQLLAAVYTECVDRLQAAVVDALDRVGSDAGPERVVFAAVDAFLTAFEDERLARVSWTEIRGVSPEIDALYQQRTRGFALLLAVLAERLYPQSLPDPHLRATIAIALVGAASETAFQWLLSGYAESKQTIAAGIAEVFLGVLDRPARPS